MLSEYFLIISFFRIIRIYDSTCQVAAQVVLEGRDNSAEGKL